MELSVYSKHPVFEEPVNRSVKIWRYRPFDRFKEELNKQALFFSSLDKLGDKFEGSYTEGNKIFRDMAWKQRAQLLSSNGIPQPMIEHMKNSNYLFDIATRGSVVVNCWHINEYESAAMWRIYSNQKKGVAIQSTFNGLVKSVERNKEDEICIGTVKYIDYAKETFPIGNFFFPYVYKRKSFEFEHELRAAILEFPIDYHYKGNPSRMLDEKQKGKFVSVNLDALIENIYISPEAKSSFESETKSILKKSGLQKEVIKSDLAKDPLF
jgi:hypothetical protein